MSVSACDYLGYTLPWKSSRPLKPRSPPLDEINLCWDNDLFRNNQWIYGLLTPRVYTRKTPWESKDRYPNCPSFKGVPFPSFWVSMSVFGRVYLQNVTWHHRFVGDPSVYWLKPINHCATRKPLVREHAHMRRRLAGRFIAASVSSSLSAKKCRTSSKLSLSCQMGCIFHMFLKGVMMGDVCFCEFQINSITKPAKPTPDLHS